MRFHFCRFSSSVQKMQPPVRWLNHYGIQNLFRNPPQIVTEGSRVNYHFLSAFLLKHFARLISSVIRGATGRIVAFFEITEACSSKIECNVLS